MAGWDSSRRGAHRELLYDMMPPAITRLTCSRAAARKRCEGRTMRKPAQSRSSNLSVAHELCRGARAPLSVPRSAYTASRSTRPSKPPLRRACRSRRAPAHHGSSPQPTPRPHIAAGSGAYRVARPTRRFDDEEETAVGRAVGGRDSPYMRAGLTSRWHEPTCSRRLATDAETRLRSGSAAVLLTGSDTNSPAG